MNESDFDEDEESADEKYVTNSSMGCFVFSLLLSLGLIFYVLERQRERDLERISKLEETVKALSPQPDKH